MIKSNYLFLDLEMNQPSGKIIQIGYCIADIYKSEIKSQAAIYVDPKEELNPRIVELTGIKQTNVNNSFSLLEAYEMMAADAKRYDCWINAVTWGGGDSQELHEQLMKQEIPFEWIFGRRWLDVKTIWHFKQISAGKQVQGGLARCMTKMGLKFEGRKHDAMDDSYNTYRMFQALRGDKECVKN